LAQITTFNPLNGPFKGSVDREDRRLIVFCSSRKTTEEVASFYNEVLMKGHQGEQMIHVDKKAICAPTFIFLPFLWFTTRTRSCLGALFFPQSSNGVVPDRTCPLFSLNFTMALKVSRSSRQYEMVHFPSLRVELSTLRIVGNESILDSLWCLLTMT